MMARNVLAVDDTDDCRLTLHGMLEATAIPVILVTAHTGDDDVLDGYQHGADHYITKPCTARQVAHGICAAEASGARAA